MFNMDDYGVFFHSNNQRNTSPYRSSFPHTYHVASERKTQSNVNLAGED
jgi:hypothetical protein